jgi:ElaB/YqjD/DUF883 family membrane-anchored ribosome-binding protein
MPESINRVEGFKGKAQDLADSAAMQTRDALSTAQQKASELASGIAERAQQAASTVADQLQSGGRYLSEQGSQLMDETAGLIRKHPLASLCAAFTLGCCLGMLSRRR